MDGGPAAQGQGEGKPAKKQAKGEQQAQQQRKGEQKKGQQQQQQQQEGSTADPAADTSTAGMVKTNKKNVRRWVSKALFCSCFAVSFGPSHVQRVRSNWQVTARPINQNRHSLDACNFQVGKWAANRGPRAGCTQCKAWQSREESAGVCASYAPQVVLSSG